MLWPLLVQRKLLFGEAVGQRLHEVGIHGVAAGAGHGVAVVRVEVQSLLGVHQRLEAVVALRTTTTMVRLTVIDRWDVSTRVV